MRGVGVDLVDIERFSAKLARGGSFRAEVFSDAECGYCESQALPATHYAARFAAKEAFLKAVGRGLFEGIALNDIEVLRDRDAAPSLRLGPSASAALSAIGATEARVSLSHDGGLAIALVVVA
jgi:holo-[acyl-carrier protein] synthase